MPQHSLIPPNASQHKDALASHLGDLLHIRAYCVGVLNTTLYPATNPPPSWFNTLDGHLAAAKRTAETWTVTLDGALVAGVPEMMIHFGHLFRSSAGRITQILRDSGNHPNASQRSAITNDLLWLAHHLHRTQHTISHLQSQFQSFQTASHTDFEALTSGVNSIQHAINADQQTIATINADIVTQKANIEHDNVAIDAAAIAAGSGLVVGAGLLGLGATAGPAAPVLLLVGGFFLVGSVAEAAAVIATFEHKLAVAENKINQD